MKQISKNVLWPTISLGIFCIGACSNDLSRSEAKKLIIKYYNYPIIISETIDLGEKICVSTSTRWLQSLHQNGLIKYSYHHNSYGCTGIVSIALTDKGKEYLIGKPEKHKWPLEDRWFVRLKLGERVMGEVTGIAYTQDKRSANIDYTWLYGNLTPFSKNHEIIHMLGTSNIIPQSNKNEPVKETTMATLYDDGWRITENRNILDIHKIFRK